MFSSAFAVFTVSKLHFTRRSYKFKHLLFILNRNQCTSYYLTRFVCCGQLRHLSFQVTLVWDSGQIRAFSASARHQFFRTYTTFSFCSPVRWFIALSLKLSSSDYLCAVISYFYPAYRYPTLFYRNSHVVLSHIHRSQSQRWINATFITQLLSSNCTIQESWGEFSDEADS